MSRIRRARMKIITFSWIIEQFWVMKWCSTKKENSIDSFFFENENVIVETLQSMIIYYEFSCFRILREKFNLYKIMLLYIIPTKLKHIWAIVCPMDWLGEMDRDCGHRTLQISRLATSFYEFISNLRSTKH